MVDEETAKDVEQSEDPSSGSPDNSPTPFEESVRKVAEGVSINAISAGVIYLGAVAGGLLDRTPLTLLVIGVLSLLLIWQVTQHVLIPLLGRPLTMEKVLLVVAFVALQAFILSRILGIP